MGDEVIVEFTGQSQATPKVIGFRDNPKPCGFDFLLTRADGVIVTPAIVGTWSVYNSLGASVPITATYNADPALSRYQHWSLVFTNQADANDANGYWVGYSCDNGIPSQYPYRYRPADQLAPADLIRPGSYVDTIPYWRVGPVTYSPNTTHPLFHGEGGNREITVALTVYSSIPFEVKNFNVGEGISQRFMRFNPEEAQWVSIISFSSLSGNGGVRLNFSDGAELTLDDLIVTPQEDNQHIYVYANLPSHDFAPYSGSIAGQTISVTISETYGTATAGGFAGDYEGNELSSWGYNLLGFIDFRESPLSFTIDIL